MKQQVKISQVIPNKDNPRVIKGAKFKELVKSIKGFPKMFEKRPIVVDENMIVLGGNMRLKAAQAAGLKEVWVDDTEEWTEEEKREFIIKDNVPYGEWEWDILGNEWDSVLLNEYGLDVWENKDDVSNTTDYSMNTADEKLSRFLDAKIKNITIPFETEEFVGVVGRLEHLLVKYNCLDYRALIYKILENEKV
jgi:hypothetical protein